MFAKRVQNEKSFFISSIRSDYGGEFENHVFENFYNENDIFHNFSSRRALQQNGVIEGRTDLCEKWPKLCFWKVVYQKVFG